jgi:hypothetical protein
MVTHETKKNIAWIFLFLKNIKLQKSAKRHVDKSRKSLSSKPISGCVFNS